MDKDARLVGASPSFARKEASFVGEEFCFVNESPCFAREEASFVNEASHFAREPGRYRRKFARMALPAAPKPPECNRSLLNRAIIPQRPAEFAAAN